MCQDKERDKPIVVESEPLYCSCGEELDDIGCEKTVTCSACGLEWKYDYQADDVFLAQPDDNDVVYHDR